MGVNLKENYQRLQADLQQQIEAYYYKQQKEIPATCISKKRKPIKKPKVLLTEDSIIIRTVNTIFLESLGYDVTTTKNGRETFDALQNKFDLILLDIGLPDISGIDICKWARKYSANQTTPIIFFTAFGNTAKNKCIDAGCDDFATKPLSMKKLQQLIYKNCN